MKDLKKKALNLEVFKVSVIDKEHCKKEFEILFDLCNYCYKIEK